MITGKKLNEKINIRAEHALYREDGKWYHHLKDFPGVLFDKDGYIVFQSVHEYNQCPQLKHGKDLHVDGGISSIKAYKAFTEYEKKMIDSIT